MELSNQINVIIENTKSLSLKLAEDSRLDLLSKDLSSATEKAVDGAAKYIIKAMPVPDAVKDVLLDVKESLKTKDLKTVITTAVNSSIREGLEIIGLSKESINSLSELKKIASRGGLVTAVKNGIEILASNYLKNNIVGDYVYDFFDKLKGYVQNKDFVNKLEIALKRLEDKKEDFLAQCEEWYNAYKNMDMTKINDISEKIGNNNYILERYQDCKKENSIIQNMTAMINNKKDILSVNQQRLCEVL